MRWFARRGLRNFQQLPKIERYLEVGVFSGDSFFWVLQNLQPSFAIAIDPYMEDTKRTLEETQAIGDGVWNRWTKEFPHVKGALVREPSLRVLPELLHNRDLFDLVYIDGSHHGLDVFCDGAMAIHLVAPGGHIVFDDLIAKSMSRVRGLRLALDTLQRLCVDDFEIVAWNTQLVMRRFEESKRTHLGRCRIGKSYLEGNK